ncbi:MAG: ABC transporter ATP-binding protein [Nocardiopsaceae bacterium]|jgi:peptide/nickel transport system ATP-binding protein|nr:ABC transporter ATP-binding protein [Nocardiopsaceae bacterium]
MTIADTTPAEREFSDRELLLDVHDVSVEYGTGGGALRAVDGVRLELRRGEVLGIVGESGSGKTTLAFAISRLLKPPGRVTTGHVRYFPVNAEPVDLLTMSDGDLRAFRWSALSVVFQSAMNTLNPVLRIRSQFADVLRTHRPGIGPAEIRKRTLELLEMVGIAADRADGYAHELSGGMRQRATIALALALEPEIIIMDEPTTALDVVLQRQILMEIMQLQERLGFSVIFITHDLSLLIELADTIMVMYAGRLVEVGSASEIHLSPRHPYSRGLLRSFPRLDGPRRRLVGIPGSPPDLKALPTGCAFHPRCPDRLESCTAITPGLTPTGVASDSSRHHVSCLLYDGSVLAMPPRLRVPLGDQEVIETAESAATPTAAAGGARQPILEAVGLSKSFGHVHAVEDVSFALYPGKITALVGESGSGKSTVARLLARLYPPTAGEVRLHGERAGASHGRALRRYVREVQLILQDPFASLNPVHRIEYHLARPLKVHGFARSKNEVVEAIAQLMSEVSLTPPQQFTQKFPHELSGGQRQRIAVARALAARPAVLLADEPVSMLDVSIRLSLLNLFARLVSDRDIALLYITHDIASARQFCEDIIVMYAGQVVETGPAEAVVRDPAHPYTRLLIESSPDPSRRIRAQGGPVRGDAPSAVATEQGCRFQARCPSVMDICKTSVPPPVEVAGNHTARCWLHSDGRVSLTSGTSDERR